MTDMIKPIFFAFIPRFFSVVVANTNPDNTTVCIGLKCEMNEQCVIRKFWCDYTECPQMIYCSKSRLESLRGPATCESVLCPNGYKCVYRDAECVWNHGCKQRLARCISNVEFADQPATCADVKCGKGLHCILRETHYCPRPPCRLTKSCAYTKDAEIWFDKCRQLGCRSEHECFLRRPPEKCATSSCDHIPDCLVTPDSFDSISSKLCYGWICPADQVCLAYLKASCSTPSVNCPIFRSCSRPLVDLTQRVDSRTTLSDIERDIFLEEQRRLQQYHKPLNFTQMEIQQYYDGFLPIAGQSWKNSDDAVPFPMKSERVNMNPIMWSTSKNGGNSVWLTYLKRRAGAEAIRYWIDKAKSNQDYEGFVEWLDTVEQLLDPDTYSLWLMEVESASINLPEFQAWISPRILAAHRLAAAASATEKTLPVSIADSRFYNDMPQDFGEAVKNSWKSWQSYYHLKPPGLSKFAGQVADTKSHQKASVPQMFFMDGRYATTLKRNGDVAARNLGMKIEQIEGYNKIQPNVAKLDPNQSAAQLMLSSVPKDDEELPNLLIYFPPPLNFFIYYSVGSRNHTANVTLETDDNDYFKSKVGLRIFNSDSYIPEDYDDKPIFYNKTSLTDKQKEFEFIRKIIRELINYWDDEERSFGKSDKFNDDDVGVRMANFHGKPVRFTSTVTNERKSEEVEGKPTFNTFLEWLFKNGHINLTQLSDLALRRKNPLFSEESVNSPRPINSENNKNSTPGKIHILGDVDKNSEIIKKLFSMNITNNQYDSDSRRYQVPVNLNDYVEPQQEDLISRRLMNIASKSLRRNISGDEKMPKVLWVFPVYGNEENETIINEIKKEKVNTLEDVDAPTTHTDNKDGLHYMPNNPNANSGTEDVDQVKSADDNSDKDTEGEYYDDQDAYDEDNYEQSELNGSMET